MVESKAASDTTTTLESPSARAKHNKAARAAKTIKVRIINK
jgi:hypothetical protein